LKYLFIPYYTLPDSSVEVTDSDIEEYINKHKEEYQVKDGRTINYVSFSIAPSKEDTIAAQKDIETVKKDFVAADDDSAFVALNSDNPAPVAYKHVDELPVAL